MVYDETDPELRPGNIPALRLDAYDFIRRCSRHEDAFIYDSELSVCLDRLHRLIAIELFDKRRELKKMQEKSAKKKDPVSGEAGQSKKVSSGQNKPALDLRRRKKARIDHSET